jgi:16S rRNA G1207 methylase RsmC
MFDPIPLLEQVRSRIQSPIAIILGSPRLVVDLISHLEGDMTCYQLDLHQSEKLKQELMEAGRSAKVETLPDLWDLPNTFQTAIFPVSKHGERELKLDMIEQAYHILQPKGLFLSLSEYVADQLLPKWHKKIFGKCSELPGSKEGSIFWSNRTDDHPRRRHELAFRAKLKDGISRDFISRPGVFSYGEFDDGSRSLIEVAQIEAGNSVLDLGCGVGVVGILASDLCGPTGEMTFVDSNVRAIALAEINAKANNLTRYRTMATHDLSGLPNESYDVILANPPYYATSAIANLFIERSKPLLKPNGRFYLVTKQVHVISEMMQPIFGELLVFENRGYHIVMGIRGDSKTQTPIP